MLRTKGLSIKLLDAATRKRLRAILIHLHRELGLSLNDIARLLGNKTSGYTSWVCRSLEVPVRPFEEARLKGIREKRRIHEKRPFDGTDDDRAYLLGLRHSDLSVSRPWMGVVRVSTSTTHPAMAELFHSLFDAYGHVYEAPRYKKGTDSYEWNLSVILDGSFEFLFSSIGSSWSWIKKRKQRIISYVAGFLDAEGSIGISRNYKTVSCIVSIYNTNLKLPTNIKRGLEGLGYNVLGPYLDKRKGTLSGGYRIARRKGYWRIAVRDFFQSQSLLGILPLRHAEKTDRKALALKLRKGTKWICVRPEVESLRRRIRNDRDDYVERAASTVRNKLNRGTRRVGG